MSERSRFSGTASLFNRFNSFIFAVKFWVYIALAVAIIIFAWRAYPVLKEWSLLEFIIRASLYEFTVKTGQPWPWLVEQKYHTAAVTQMQEYHDIYRIILNSLKKSGYEGLGGGFLVIVLGFWLGRKEARSQTEDRHRRESQLVTPKELTRCLSKTEGDGRIILGEVRLPRAIEVRGLFAIGILGVGKTQLQNHILDAVVERDERGIIFTAKGDDFIATHWRTGDVIFCPADARTVGWSLMYDITDLSDFDIGCVAWCRSSRADE
ncbi:MAG: type IV secretion system DNA-binding domain-containing protein [Trichlorobacter sp.]|nr:type IV secretion system DNA-binding domain-containing protein [Trichlorobacter sp.]